MTEILKRTRSAREKVRRMAKRLGATFKVNSPADPLDVGVEAPRDHVWSCGVDIHELIGNCSDPFPEDVAETWEDLLDRMRYGVERCEVKDCEWCNSSE